MNLIFNILSLIFDTLIVRSFFPITVILLTLSLFSFRFYKKDNKLLFFLIALFFVFSIRIVFGLFFGGGNILDLEVEQRRFYGVTALSLILTAGGWGLLVTLTEKYTRKISTHKYLFFLKTKKNIYVFFLILFSIICVGKGLSPPSYKAYVHEPGEEIIKHNTGSRMPILLYDNSYIHTYRLKYYSNAKCYNLSNIIGKKKNAKLLKQLNNFINSGNSVFILANNLEDRFSKKNKSANLKVKKIKSWEKGKYSLYKCIKI